MRATCPQGHEWELSGRETTAVVSCPVCGQSTRISPAGGQKTPHEPMATTAPDLRTAPSTTPILSPSWPTIEGYEVLEELGQGGMGVVYKAKQFSLQRIVAIKMMGASTSASAERFKIEAEAVAHLQHANIVQIYEVGEQDGRAFLALEFVEGGTLSKKLTQGPLDPFEAARLVETLARALHHAHERGILHRDIKPGNVLLTKEGTPKITDFGLAKRLEGPGVTQTGQGILGTPSYMAPEQAEGKSKKLGPGVDVYALGATLYEILTGRPPFREDTPLETMLKVTREEPLSLSQLRANVPRDLETICLKCLQKSPALRYPSALALAEDLRRFIEGESIHARPPTPWERGLRWLRRNREKVAILSGAVAVVALLIVMLMPPRSDPGDPGKKVAPQLPDDLPSDLALIPRNSPAFITFKMADILAREDLVELSRVIAKKLPLGLISPEGLAGQIERETGIRPADITRLTLVFSEPAGTSAKLAKSPTAGLLTGWLLGGENAPLAILTTSSPYDREKLKAVFKGAPQGRTHRGKEYLASSDPDSLAVAFVSDRILAVTRGEPNLRTFLDTVAAADRRAPLAEALVLAQQHPCVAGLRPTSKQRSEWTEQIVQGLKTASDAPPDLEAKIQAFWQMDAVTFTLDWELRTARGDVVQSNLHLTYPDDATAKQGSAALELIRKAMVKGFKKAQEEVKRMEEDFPELAQFKGFATLLVGEFEVALQTARPQTQGRKINVQLQVRVDIPEWFASLGPATAQVEKAALRARTLNQLKQIGVALHAYHEAHGRLPAARVEGKDGRPLHSWRVELLPFLGEDEKKLHAEFKLDEPWDSPHNKKLLARMPQVYQPLRREAPASLISSVEMPLTVGSSWTSLVPGQSRLSTAVRALGWGSTLMPIANPFVRRNETEGISTCFQVVVTPGSAFEGKEGFALSRDFSDGTSGTILVVEASDLVPWTKPAEVDLPAKRPFLRTVTVGDDGIAVLFADGGTRILSRNLSEPQWRALLTRNGGEKIDINKLP